MGKNLVWPRQVPDLGELVISYEKNDGHNARARHRHVYAHAHGYSHAQAHHTVGAVGNFATL